VQQPRESDRLASFLVHREVQISAELDLIWDLQVRVNAWPSWQPGIDAAWLAETMAVGAEFQWSDGVTLTTATVATVTPLQRLVWRATDPTATGVHQWTFERSGKGTRVTATELFEHFHMVDDAARSPADVDDALAYWLQNLKAEAEART
jgi:hypothetical protein